MSPGRSTAETDTELPTPLRGCGSEMADFPGVETLTLTHNFRDFWHEFCASQEDKLSFVLTQGSCHADVD